LVSHTEGGTELRVLREILEPEMEEVAGEWRKLHHEELHDLYCSPKFY
jgi:hypothetical protein